MIRIESIALVVLVVMTASGCGGGSSAQSPQPPPAAGGLSISSLSPSSAPADGPDLMLAITGTGFDGAGAIQSRVTWTSGGNETVLVRTVTSTTQIAATIRAALLKSPVTAQIAVEEYDRIEGTVNAQSNSLGSLLPPLGTVPLQFHLRLRLSGRRAHDSLCLRLRAITQMLFGPLRKGRAAARLPREASTLLRATLEHTT